MIEKDILLYDKLLLSELRILTYTSLKAQASDKLIQKALTLNENLKSLGYTLRGDDILRLATSPCLDDFFVKFKSLLDEVDAKPMYPDFPKTVMDLDEATLRMHQLIHYFSTYGIKQLFGIETKTGWIPLSCDTEKTENDEKLLDAKVLHLLDEEKKFEEPIKKLLARKQRLNDKEKLLVKLGITDLSPDFLAEINVPFKENLFEVFNAIFSAEIEGDKKLSYLKAIAKHTGDCFKCIDFCLTKNNYHFKTSQKRILVKLLESFTPFDFENNLILSAKKAKRSLIVLNYLDYNLYSKSPAHKNLVEKFRDGELLSWLSLGEKAIKDGTGIEFFKQRPGILLRYVTRFLKEGYLEEAIYSALADNVEALSLPTLISILTNRGRLLKFAEKWGYKPINYNCDILNLFGYDVETPLFCGDDNAKTREKLAREYTEISKKLYAICYKIFKLKIKQIHTPIKNKKLYLNFKNYDVEKSEIQLNERASDGGYVRSGIAYKIPDSAKIIRFFVFWSDKDRVDIDLHASALSLKGENIEIGWNARFKNSGIIFSGDLTTSNSAEYIDVDLSKPIKDVSFNINLFSGKQSFKEIETCFIGVLAVAQLGQKIRFYNRNNCFFEHLLTSEASALNYGYVDVENRTVVFDGKIAKDRYYGKAPHYGNEFSLKKFLDDLFESQNVEIVSDKDSADIVLIMDKPVEAKDLSLLDNNFFVDCE